MLGGIEMGGTKMVCAVSLDGRSVLAEVRYPTGSDPAAAMARAADFFLSHDRPLDALGVGAFGPCDPSTTSPTYGHITTTPKPGWAGADVLGLLRGRLGGVPIAFDTDVNAAALGELRCGAGRGLESLVYLTIGTGIGGGAVAGGRLIHGLTHPEMGHIRVRRPAEEIGVFPGVCPFHGDCLEGVASGPALAARWGVPGPELPPDHPAWELEANYLAESVATLVLVLSPQRIVVGGGVGLAPRLIERIRPRVLALIGGYVRHEQLAEGAEEFIVAPALGDQAGVVGALCLAQDALA